LALFLRNFGEFLLDGKIDGEFWDRKQRECREQERGLQVEISRLGQPITKANWLTVETIFELAKVRTLCTLREIYFSS
jgi:hypothetical protein